MNKGVITGSRRYKATPAAVSPEQEQGSIYGSTNNGAIGTDTSACTASGGIAVENNGSIASSYNSGKIHCGDKNHQGHRHGYQLVDDVNSVFYNNVNSIPTMGPE